MSRPVKADIAFGIENWDAEVDGNFDTLLGGPLPAHQWPSSGTKTLAELETQYPAANYDQCVVMLVHATRGRVPCYSNGTSWRIMALEPAVVTLTDAASIAVDAAAIGNGGTGRVTLAGNRTLQNPTNAHDGHTIIIEVLQDGTGSRTLAYDTKYRFGTSIPSPTLTTTAGKTDFLMFKYNATADKWNLIALNQGF